MLKLRNNVPVTLLISELSEGIEGMLRVTHKEHILIKHILN